MILVTDIKKCDSRFPEPIEKTLKNSLSFWNSTWNLSRLGFLRNTYHITPLFYCPSTSVNELSTPVSYKYSCDACNKVYATYNGLTKHKQFHCPAFFRKPEYNCNQCKKSYSSVGALKMHIRTHTLPCKCPFCGKAFSRPWLLQGHIRTHTGEKPFRCSTCERAFADRSNLRAHIQTHTNAKKYSCSCSKTFSRMSLLAKHKAVCTCL